VCTEHLLQCVLSICYRLYRALVTVCTEPLVQRVLSILQNSVMFN